MAYKKSAQKQKQQELAEKIKPVKKKASPKKSAPTKAAKEATKKKIKEIVDSYTESMVEAKNVLPSGYYKFTSKSYFKAAIVYLKASISMFFIYLKKSLKK